jgi:outer membrane protein assembly factor BamB
MRFATLLSAGSFASARLVSVSLLVVAGLLWCAAGDGVRLAHAGDWPQWRGPQRDDISQETGLLAKWPADGPPRLWLFENCGEGFSGPAIVGDRLYVLGAREGKELLLCLDATAGTELWNVEIGEKFGNGWGDGPRGTPTCDGGRVYALGAQGNLICVDAATGEQQWSKSMLDLGGKIPVWGYSESPLIVGEKLYCTPGGGQGAIVALDKNTGEKLWQVADITSEAHYSSIVAAPIHGRLQCIQLLVDQAVGIDAESGELLWRAPWPGRVAVIPTPIVRGNEIYFTSGYGVGCMLLRIGTDNRVEKVYDNKELKNHHGGVILVGDHLYGHSDKAGWVCQDFSTGEGVWRERDALGKGAVAYADGKLYCLSEDEGYVALVEASSAGWQELSRFTLSPQTELERKSGKIWTHPVISNGRLYLRDQDKLFCFDIREGSLRAAQR